MKRFHVGFVLAVLLATFISATTVIIVEVPDDDAKPVHIKRVIDGDTVELVDGLRVRLVGYDAYELSEQRGVQARQELSYLCSGKVFLDIDDLEAVDRYGRTLGYLWCPRRVENITMYISIQKHFILGDGRRYVKRLVHIPPDEHPYTLWFVRHVLIFDREVEIRVYNDTRSPHRMYGDRVTLTSGVYKVYYGNRLVARLRLMSPIPNTTTVNLPNATPATATAEPQRVTVTTTVTRTVAATTTQMVTTTTTVTITTARVLPVIETRTVTRTATTTVTDVVEKPYIHPITYIATAAAIAVLAACLARRRR